MRRLAGVLLAVVLLLSVFVPAAAAEPAQTLFTDWEEIQNQTAASVLIQLGLISGYADGSFRPAEQIRRDEIAKLVAFVCSDAPGAQQAAPFADLTGSWAADYIAFCVERGIISAQGSLFRPADPVTVRELAKMLLVVLGEDDARYTGSAWQENADADAGSYGIYSGVQAARETPVTRDDACRMILNAMLCPAVADASRTDAMRYALDELMNPKTYLETRFGLVRYSGVLTANETANLQEPGKRLPAGVSHLAGHREFQASTGEELLGRSLEIFMKDGRVVCICPSAGDFCESGLSVSRLLRLLDAGKYSVSDGTEVYVDYEPASQEALAELADTDAAVRIVDRESDGVLDAIFVNS